MTSADVVRQSEPTFHHESSSKYFLPNDAAERYRLRKQHEAIVAFMHNEPIHAPIPSNPGPSKILDLGCGVNASMTLLLAKKFPNATIYGVDLSDVNIEDKPDNVSFIQGNIYNLIDQDPRLARGSADYIYSRFMSAGVDDWSEHVKSISSLLAPGGYIELHEGVRAAWLNENDEEISRDWKWLNIAHPGMFWPPNDPTGLKFFQSKLSAAGLEDVQGKVYKLTSSDKPEARLWSEYARDLFATAWVAPLQRLVPGDENKEKRKELEAELFETLKPKEGVYFPCIVVWGRKSAA